MNASDVAPLSARASRFPGWAVLAALLAAVVPTWWLMPYRPRASLGRGGVVWGGFSPDSKSLATYEYPIYERASLEDRVRVWDVATAKERFSVPVQEEGPEIYARFSPDSKSLVALIRSGTLGIYDAATGEQRHQIEEAGEIPVVRFSPGGTFLALAVQADEPVWRIVEVASGKAILTLPLGPNTHPDLATSHELFVFAPDDRALVSWTGDEECTAVTLWDMTNRHRRIDLQGAGLPLVFSPDGRYLATGSGAPGQPGRVFVWDAATGAKRFGWQVSPKRCDVALVFSPDGRTLAVRAPSAVKLIDLATGRERAAFAANPVDLLAARRQAIYLSNPVAGHFLKFSPDGQRLAEWDSELYQECKEIRLRDSVTGEVLARLEGQEAPDFTADGATVITWSPYSVILHDAATGAKRATYSAGELVASWVNGVYYSAVAADGKTLAVLHRQDPETNTRSPLQEFLDMLPGNGQPDTRNPPVVLNLFDAAAARELAAIRLEDTYRVTLSPDGKALATEGGQVVQLWDVPPRKPVEWIVVPAVVLVLLIVWRSRRKPRIA